MKDQHILTQEGYDNLIGELKELKETKRKKAVERLKKAREMGDLSENSEYASAKETLSFIDGRIQEIEAMLKQSKVVNKHTNREIVKIGCAVEVEIGDVRDNFTIVGEFETDIIQKKISHTSPIGKALLGKRRGEKVEVIAPKGKVIYKIVDIK